MGDFEPSVGTIARANAVCPMYHQVIEAKKVRELAQNDQMGQRMVIVVLHKPRTKGKRYRIAKDDYKGVAFTNTLARWENTSEALKHLYSRQALPMLWDYVEVNSFSNSSGSWNAGGEYYIKVLNHCSQISKTPATITQSSATSMPYPDNYFDAVFYRPTIL